MGAADKGIQPLDPVSKPVCDKKIQRPISHRRLRSQPFGTQMFKDFIRPKCTVLFQKQLHHPLADRRQLQILRSTLGAKLFQPIRDAVFMVMRFKSECCHLLPPCGHLRSQRLICYTVTFNKSRLIAEKSGADTMRSFILAATVFCGAANADVPDVVTDILPVQSLAAQVMDGLGTPDVLLRPGASPHGYALRPTEARALQEAELVFWVGPALTPWLTGPLETLSGEALHVALLDAAGTEVLQTREGPLFEAEHPHDDDAHADEVHAEDAPEEKSHDGHAHDDHAASEHAQDDTDHGHEHEAHGDDDHHAASGHTHSGPDPHAWLDPSNARVWLAAIAQALGDADPDNADTYRANAQTAIEALEVQEQHIADRLSPLSKRSFTVYHDAFQYFEHRFGLTPLGAIAMNDASAPGPARLTALRDRLTDAGVQCVFSEPQYNAGLIRAVSPEGAAHAVLDPLGAELPAGAGLYAGLLEALSTTIEECLGRAR